MTVRTLQRWATKDPPRITIYRDEETVRRYVSRSEMEDNAPRAVRMTAEAVMARVFQVLDREAGRARVLGYTSMAGKLMQIRTELENPA